MFHNPFYNGQYIGFCTRGHLLPKPQIKLTDLRISKCTRTNAWSQKASLAKQVKQEDFNYRFFLEWSFMDDISDNYYGIDSVHEAEKPDRKIENNRFEPCSVCASQIGKTAIHRGYEGINNCAFKKAWHGKSCRTRTALKCRFPGCGKKFLCSTGNRFSKVEAINHLIADHGLSGDKLKDLKYIVDELNKLYTSRKDNEVYRQYKKKFKAWAVEIRKELEPGKSDYRGDISEKLKQRFDKSLNKRKLMVILQKIRSVKSLHTDIQRLQRLKEII